MVARLSLLLSILLAADSTLPNGIRVHEVSSTGNTSNSFELIAGYRAGLHGENEGSRGLAEVVAAFLKSTTSARKIAVAAYGAGGEIEFISELDRTGIRLKMPAWAKPMVESSIAEFLSETPQKNPELVDRALEEVRSRSQSGSSIRTTVEEQFRIALMGPAAKSDLAGVTRDAVNAYFAKNYGTDRAFVVMNSKPPDTLQSVERRVSTNSPTVVEGSPKVVPLSSALRVASDLDQGVLILGVPTPTIYYRKWYAFLMLDRLIRETVLLKPRTQLVPSLEPYFYRIEVGIPSGQAFEDAEAALRQELDQLQYVRASSERLEIARQSALQYLESDAVQKWFLILGVPERRAEGWEWVAGFSADDMRATARDIVESRPVVAGWTPRVREVRLVTEKLSDIRDRATNDKTALPSNLAALGPVEVVPFSAHSDAAYLKQAPVLLSSGVSAVASSAYAVFVAPDSSTALTIYDQEPDKEWMNAAFGVIRPNRILVMAPPESLERITQQWTEFKGNPNDETVVTMKGNVAGPYIPTLFLLKMMLDRRLIEAGMWSDVQLEIRVSEGSLLSIQSSEADRRQVLGWLDEIASKPIDKEELEWAQEAAIHHLHRYQPDLQSLIWEWIPNDFIPDFHHIPPSLIQFVARTYVH